MAWFQRRAIGALAALALGATSLGAQQERLSLEVGASALSLEGLRPTRSLTLVPSYSRQGLSGALNVAGAVAMAPEGEWSGQAILSGARFIAPSPFGRYEVGALLSGVAYGESEGTATSLLQVRSVRGDALDGLWMGAGGGVRWRGNGGRMVLTGDVGAWRSFRSLRVTGQIAVSRAYEDTLEVVRLPYPGNDMGLPTNVTGGFGNVYVRQQRPVAFGTALLGASWSRGPFDVEATVSSRTPLEDGRASHAALGSITYHVDQRLAIVAAGGRQQSDQVLGIPSGGFATLGVRFSTRSGAEPLRTGTTVGVSVVPRRGGTHLLRLEMPNGAGSIEIAGDFSGWEPITLSRRGGAWETVLTIPSGSYRVAIRIDGGEWIAPPGLPQIADELGGIVGILIIP